VKLKLLVGTTFKKAKEVLRLVKKTNGLFAEVFSSMVKELI
jgi:hypothetical protein